MASRDEDEHGYYGTSGPQNDPHVYPNGVLINNLGIQNTQDLNAAENTLTELRITQLAISPIEGQYDLAHAKAIHRHIFGDIYPWAGDIRQVDIYKGDTLFLEQAKIEAYFEQIEEHLQVSGLRGARWKISVSSAAPRASSSACSTMPTRSVKATDARSASCCAWWPETTATASIGVGLHHRP